MNARPDRPSVALLVLGMHRSGTSATSGALRLLGVELGDRLIEAAEDNPKGYWEHADAVDIHDRLLAGLSRSWDDVRRLPEGWHQHPACEVAKSAIRGVVEEFAGNSFWALKDPRLSRFASLWLAELEAARRVPACLFVVRHPEEVAASLLARNGLPSLASHLLWIRHVLEAARDTARVSRAMITYDALLRDPCACLGRVASALRLEWPVAPDDARHQLAEFLDRAEKHQVNRGGVQGADETSILAGLVGDLYAKCVQISEGSAGWDELDQFQQALDSFDTAHHGWIEASGGLKQAQSAMHDRASQRLHVRMDTLEAALSSLDAAKCAAESLAHERLAVLIGNEQRIAELERLSLDRLAETQRLSTALSETEKLGLARLDDIQGLSAQLDEANVLLFCRMDEFHAQAKAHEAAEHVAFERLAEIQRLAEAQETAEKLARDRLEEAQRLSARLDEANALALARLNELMLETKAHEAAELLAFERLAEIQRLAEAQEMAEKLARDRLEEAQRLSARLDEASALALARLDELVGEAKAHEAAEQLAYERLAEIQRLAEARDEAEKFARDRLEEVQRLSSELVEAKELASTLAAEAELLRELIAEQKRSFAWKVAGPARALESLLKPKNPGR